MLDLCREINSSCHSPIWQFRSVAFPTTECFLTQNKSIPHSLATTYQTLSLFSLLIVTTATILYTINILSVLLSYTQWTVVRVDEEEEADGQRTSNTQTMRQQKCPLASQLTALSLWRWLSFITALLWCYSGRWMGQQPWCTSRVLSRLLEKKKKKEEKL